MASSARKLPIYPAVLGIILAAAFSQAATAQQSSSSVGGPGFHKTDTNLAGISFCQLCLAAAQSVTRKSCLAIFVCAINDCSEAIRKASGDEQSDDH